MKRFGFLSLIMAVLLAFPFVFGALGCGGEENNTYVITYSGIDGATFATANPTSYKSTDEDITLCNPEKSGFEFVGWTGTGLNGITKTVTILKGSAGNRSYTANWATESNVYVITYIFENDGRTISSSDIKNYDALPKFYDGSSRITVPRPQHERSNYEFEGWTGTIISGSGKVNNVTIEIGTTGNITLTAHFGYYSNFY